MTQGVIIRAQIAAMLSATDGFNPLPWQRASHIICGAIDKAAAAPGGLTGSDEEATHRLTLAGVMAMESAGVIAAGRAAQILA